MVTYKLEGLARMFVFVFIQTPQRLIQPLMYPYSLGLLYLAAMLERKGAKVALSDLRGADLNPNLIPKARYYGFTATTGEIGYAKKLARMLKERESMIQDTYHNVVVVS